MIYTDRTSAGRVLGGELAEWGLVAAAGAPGPLLLGLPRGGVPVAAGAREVVGGALDILLVRKLGVPWQPELAAGAIGEDGARVLNDDVLAHTGLTRVALAGVEVAERAELERRRATWRAGAAAVPRAGRVGVLVDDGMAPGATLVAACRVLRRQRPALVLVAVPVSSPEALRRAAAEADDVVCPLVPEQLGGVGTVYQDFHQLADAEVTAVLRAR